MATMPTLALFWGRYSRQSEAERVELEQQREQLELEFRLVTATLRTDEALRVQDAARPADERPRLRGAWRDWVE